MFGRYTMHEQLGEGGYSTVHKCTDHIGIRYAVKKMPKTKNKRARVQQEIEIMKRITSPKVVRFVDAGEDADAYYIVQEWCRGGDVKDYILGGENIYVENTVASVVRGVLRGLIHLHEARIIHRDIKTGNILLGDRSADADVKIGDLGTAIVIPKDARDNTMTVEDLVGTPWFMSPENLRHLYHPNSDVWSLGVLTYQLLCGRMPFNDPISPLNPSLASIWREILYSEPHMKDVRWSQEVSAGARDFVKLCLTKDYMARPSALECLHHPWLKESDCTQRFSGSPLSCKPFTFESAVAMNAKTVPYILD